MAISELRVHLAKKLFGTDISAGKTCAFCGKTPEGFRDEISVRGWKISHLCQKCQDSTFGSGEDDEED